MKTVNFGLKAWTVSVLVPACVLVSAPATTVASSQTLPGKSEASANPEPEKTVSSEIAGEVRSRLLSARRLSAFGIGIWGVASIFQISGLTTIATLSDAVDGHDQNVDDNKLVRGIGYLAAGYLLNVLAPIPGVIADMRARRAIARINGGGLKVSRRQISIGGLYGVGLALAVAGAMVGSENEYWWALGLVCASEIVFGVATIAAYLRVRRLEKAPALMPIVGRGTIGLGLSGTF